jgi:hypothetical protein
MFIRIFALATLLAAVGCGASPLRRIAHPEATDVPPRIEAMVDLGALPPASSGELSREASDEVFTPGEYAAVLGPGLARADARVTVAGQALPVAGFVEGGLLVRMPRGLSPRARQTLEVVTPAGRAQQSFHYASHVVVSDVSGNHLRFMRMSPEAEKLFDDTYDLELTRVRAHAFSPDGGLVYAVQAHAEQFALATVHIAAAEHPAVVGTLSLTVKGVPQELVAAPTRGQLWLLTATELVTLDVSNATKPREIGRLALPEGTPESLAVLAEGGFAAVLEREKNLVWLFDMQGPAPQLAQALQLPPEGTARASLGLLADRTDARRLWVLQGRSLSRLSGRTGSAAGKLSGSLDRAKAAIGWGQAPSTPEPEPEAKPEPEVPTRVLGLTLGSALALDKELPLPPAFLPLFLRASSDGRLLVSGITSDAARLQGFGESGADLKGVSSLLLGSTQFGRVVAIDPSGQREPETLIQGMAMYFDIDQLPDGQLVCSTMRIGVSLGGIGIDWRIEAPRLDAVKVRTLAWTFVLPPYVSPPVSVQ